MALAQSQPDQEVAPIVEVVLLVVAGESQDKNSILSSRTIPMEGTDDTATGSEGRSAAVAERAEDGDSDAGNYAHSN